MTAQNKSIAKSVKSLTPATKNKTAQPAAKKSSPVPTPPAKSVKVAVAAPIVPAVRSVPATPVAPAKPVAPGTPAATVARVVKSAPAVVPVTVKSVVTTITACVDVGFGNALYLRGDGAGLSWDQGRKMDCVRDDMWRITLEESARGIAFKFLVNDLTWSAGPDYTTTSGANVTLTPEF